MVLFVNAFRLFLLRLFLGANPKKCRSVRFCFWRGGIGVAVSWFGVGRVL